MGPTDSREYRGGARSVTRAGGIRTARSSRARVDSAETAPAATAVVLVVEAGGGKDGVREAGALEGLPAGTLTATQLVERQR